MLRQPLRENSRRSRTLGMVTHIPWNSDLADFAGLSNCLTLLPSLRRLSVLARRAAARFLLWRRPCCPLIGAQLL